MKNDQLLEKKEQVFSGYCSFFSTTAPFSNNSAKFVKSCSCWKKGAPFFQNSAVFSKRCSFLETWSCFGKTVLLFPGWSLSQPEGGMAQKGKGGEVPNPAEDGG